MKPYLIGIAGGSSSGKTTLAKMLARSLPPGSTVLLGLDSYYRDLSGLTASEIERHNLDEPGAIDETLLLEQVGAIAHGRAISKPVYDYKTHTRGKDTEHINPRSFVILEGLFTLHWEELRRLFGTKVFVDASHEVCLERRIARDARERARTAEEVKRRYDETVRPMFEKHVLPTRKFADVIMNGEVAFEHAIPSIIDHMDKMLAR